MPLVAPHVKRSTPINLPVEASMSERKTPTAVVAAEVPARSKPSVYPEPFASRMAGRKKRQLGEVLGLKNLPVTTTCCRVVGVDVGGASC
jgi:hypothetical protein